jgi:hypothetical protein
LQRKPLLVSQLGPRSTSNSSLQPHVIVNNLGYRHKAKSRFTARNQPARSPGTSIKRNEVSQENNVMKIKHLIPYDRTFSLRKLLFFAQKGKLVKNLAISRPWASLEVQHYGTVE